MAKIQVLDIEGKKTKEISTKLFEEPVRKDIIFKTIEAQKSRQRYSPKLYAGMNRSASGSVLHTRHDWKTDRGRGMARFPKKKMWRRGTQFSWVAAIIPSARGGRRAHPPRVEFHERKINKKENTKALLSCLSYIISIEEIKKKYSRLADKKINLHLPLVIEDRATKLKTKELLGLLKKVLGEAYEVSVQKKKKRAGIGKLRGRKYRKNAGLLFVISKNENFKAKGIEVKKANELIAKDLANGGARLVMFSEKAIAELEKKLIK